jgi:hypothetical protein
LKDLCNVAETIPAQCWNPQSEILEWLTSPGSQKLGAKWVEVTVECEAGRTSPKANLKRGQQHPWRASLELRVTDVMELAEVASLWSSRGRSTIRRGEVRGQISAVSSQRELSSLDFDL